jgi:hypothetical protein
MGVEAYPKLVAELFCQLEADSLAAKLKLMVVPVKKVVELFLFRPHQVARRALLVFQVVARPRAILDRFQYLPAQPPNLK